jgi:hypothetical protein
MWALRLDIVECVRLGTAAEWLVGEETVGRHVHSEHKCWEEHQRTHFICPIEAGARLGEIGTEAGERHHKNAEVEGIAD